MTNMGCILYLLKNQCAKENQLSQDRTTWHLPHEIGKSRFFILAATKSYENEQKIVDPETGAMFRLPKSFNIDLTAQIINSNDVPQLKDQPTPVK